jgi:hypothetical protein
MRDRGLRKLYALFDVSGAEARVHTAASAYALFECLQNLSPRRVGNGVEGAVERCVGGHGK